MGTLAEALKNLDPDSLDSDDVNSLVEFMNDNLVSSNQAADVLDVKTVYFRSLLRQNKLSDLHTYTFANRDIFWRPELVIVKDYRANVIKPKSTGRTQLNLNILRAAAIVLNIQHLRVPRDKLLIKIKEVLNAHFDDIDWNNITAVDFLNIVTECEHHYPDVEPV